MAEIKNYAWPVTTTSKIVYDRFTDAIEANRKVIRDKKIVVFGAGIRGTLFSIILENLGFSNFIFTDNNVEKWGGVINKYPIVSVSKALANKEDIIVFITVENGIAIKEQLLNEGFVEDKEFFLLDTDIYDIYMTEFERKEPIDVLMMADCGITHISLLDNKKENIGEIMKQKLRDLSCKVLGMHGMGMRAFYNILCAQLYMGIKPKYLIMGVNFDTFTGKQHYLPRSQHSELIKRVAESSKIDSKEMSEYVELTHERFSKYYIEFKTNVSKNTRRTDTLGALYMRMNYMYKLKSDNEGIVYLMKILDLVTVENIIPILYIPPVNYMRGEQYFGRKFYDAYESNCKALKNMISEKKFQILDMSYILSDSEFADFSTVDECANYTGRIKICNKLAKYFRQSIKISKEE